MPRATRRFIGGPLNGHKLNVEDTLELYPHKLEEKTHYYLLDSLHHPDRSTTDEMVFFYEGEKDNPPDPRLKVNPPAAPQRMRVRIRQRKSTNIRPQTVHAKEVAHRHMKVVRAIKDRMVALRRNYRDIVEKLKVARETMRARQEIIDTTRNALEEMKADRDEARELLEEYQIAGLDPAEQLHKARLAIVELEYDREHIYESLAHPDTEEYVLCVPSAEDFEDYLTEDKEYMVWREYYFHGRYIRSQEDKEREKQNTLNAILEEARRESIKADEDDAYKVYHEAGSDEGSTERAFHNLKPLTD